MKKMTSLLLGLIFAAYATVQAGEVKVFAAASMTNTLKDLAAKYEKSSGDKIVFNFGASSEMVRQIKAGAPADIFLSADEAKMDELQKDSLVAPGTRVTLLTNSLVIVVASDSKLTVKGASDLLEPTFKRIALSDKGVPVGDYTRGYLGKKGLWEKLEGKIIPTQNVRASLGVVESGDVEVGFVYKTDAAISKKVKIAYEVPSADLTTPITYPIAILKSSAGQASVKKFYDYLTSSEASPVYKKYGFGVK